MRSYTKESQFLPFHFSTNKPNLHIKDFRDIIEGSLLLREGIEEGIFQSFRSAVECTNLFIIQRSNDFLHVGSGHRKLQQLLLLGIGHDFQLVGILALGRGDLQLLVLAVGGVQVYLHEGASLGFDQKLLHAVDVSVICDN